MAERATADERLRRILHILPVAAREGGVRRADVADALGVPDPQLEADLRAVARRAYYHPAGGAEDLQIGIDAERFTVWTAGEFARPVRLSPREAVALGLALRSRAAAAADDARRAALLELAGGLEEGLASVDPDALEPHAHYAIEDGSGGGDGLRALCREAARDRRRLRIRYWKPGPESATDRVVCPYSLVFAEGAWYLIAHCTRVDDVRVFRLDRMLEADSAEGDAGGGASFEVPEDFDPERYIASGGKLFHAEDDVEAVVRYSPRIARWIAERERFEELDDGSVVVRHSVADPRWLVRHVLQYGPEAEVLRPEPMRELVANAVRRLPV